MKILFIFLLFGFFSVQAEKKELASQKQTENNKVKSTIETPKPIAKTDNVKKQSSSLHKQSQAPDSKDVKSSVTSSKPTSQPNKKVKRNLSESVISPPCTDYFKTKHERGQIEIHHVPCSAEDYNSGLCLSQSEILRNYCKSNQLVRYYCDSREEDGYSSEHVPCEHGCVSNSGKCSL